MMQSRPRGSPGLFMNPIHGEEDAKRKSFRRKRASSQPSGRELARHLSQTRHEQLVSIFDSLDVTGSGTIDGTELALALEKLGLDTSTEHTRYIIHELDSRSGGKINAQDFLDLCEGTSKVNLDGLTARIQDDIFGSDLGITADFEGGDAPKGECCGLLHPDNTRRTIYDITQLMLLVYTMVTVPLRIGFGWDPEVWSIQFILDLVVDIFFLVDLFVQMQTYYHDNRTGEWVYDHTKIRSRYLHTWFVVDFAAVMPVDHLLRLLHKVDHNISDARAFRMLRMARIFRYIRLIKILNPRRVDKLGQWYEKKVGLSNMSLDLLFKVVSIIISIMCFNHLAACMWIFIGRSNSGLLPMGIIATVPNPDKFTPKSLHIGWWDVLYGAKHELGIHVSHWEQYVDALYFIMATITSVGYGDITPENTHEKLFCYMLLFLTCFTYSYIIGVFADVVSNRRSDTNHFERKMRSVFGFLDHVECPKDLREQVKIFYSSRYPRKTLFDEEEIYSELPSKFAQRLVLHRFERTIKHVPFFRNACAESIVRVCRQLRAFVAPAGTVIMEKGESNRELFIVEHGKAIGTDANIVTTYVPGDFFGELEFIGIGDTSPLTITAEQTCKLYGLQYMDILETLNLYPQLQAKLHEYACQRKQAMDTVRGLTGRASVEQQSDTRDSHQDILTAASTIKDMPRAQLEGVLMAAISAGTVSMDDIRSSQSAS